MKDAKTMAAMAARLVTERDREDKSCLTVQGKAKPCDVHDAEAIELPQETSDPK